MEKKELKTEPKREEKSCKVKGCKRPYRAKGYCTVHYQKWRRNEIEGAKGRYNTCSEENCRKETFKAGLCEPHYSAWSASKKAKNAPAAPAEAKPAEATA